MKTTSKLMLVLAAMTFNFVADAAVGNASAFHAWQVSDVAWNDTLNVRKYPSGKSQKLTSYQNGVSLQMTGKCTDNLSLDQVSGQPGWLQKQAVRYRWCEVWVNPAGDDAYTSGWVYGKYISPNTGDQSEQDDF